MTPAESSRRAVALGAAALALAAFVAACGGGASAPRATGATPTTSSGTAGSGGGTGPAGSASRGGFPGVSGSVAAVTGTSMEVQNPSTGQTTVAWTSSTRWSETSTVTAGDLAPGQCVTIVGTRSGSALTARTVTISPAPSGGSCRVGAAPGSGRAGAFAGRQRSNGGRAPNAPAIPLALLFGQIVSHSGPTLTVHGTLSAGGFARPGSSSGLSTPTTVAPTTLVVDLSPTTTYTETRSATASDVAVGDCVVATGSADTTGAVTARVVRITSTGGGTCPTGFGRFGGGGAGSAAPATAAGSANA